MRTRRCARNGSTGRRTKRLCFHLTFRAGAARRLVVRWTVHRLQPRCRDGFSFDVWALPLFGDRKPFALANTPFQETNARFSPDGRWVAFQSNESGRSQIYVQPIPATGGKFMVSKDGGFQPLWGPDGKELFFISTDAQMMSSTSIPPVSSGPAFGTPLRRRNLNSGANVMGRQYTVTKDGKRFLMNKVQEASQVQPLTVVVNWLAAVQK